jgi:integrase/recombinase XerD
MNFFQDYLIEYHSFEIDSNFVFITLRGNNKGLPLTYYAVNSMVKRIKIKTGISFTPHMLRHTYATELHAQGVDVGIIQKLLGHEQVQTTIQTYVHPSEQTIRESYEKAQANR